MILALVTASVFAWAQTPIVEFPASLGTAEYSKVTEVPKELKEATSLYKQAAGVGLLLTAWFIGVVGYRGKALLYGILVIVFTGLCIWALINIDEIEGLLRGHLGVWGMSGAFLLIAIIVWLCIHFLF